MKLSMWILKDWLSKYSPEAKIFSGEPILRGARILSNNTDINKENVYIARADEFISGEENRVICVQGRDMLLLNSGNIDEVLNDVFNAFDFYNDWEDELSALIESGCALFALIEKSKDLFQEPMVIYDPGNDVIAYTDYGLGSIDEEWENMLLNGSNTFTFFENMRSQLKILRNSHDVRRVEAPEIEFTSAYRSLYIDEAFAGRLICLEVRAPLTKGQFHLFDRFGRFVENWMRSCDTYLMSRSESAVFSELIEGKTVSREEADKKLQMIGWEQKDKKELIRIELGENSREVARPFFTRLEKTLINEYCIMFEDCICIFVNLEGTPHSIVAEKLMPILYSGNLCALVSFTFFDVFELAKCSEQCRVTYEYTPKQRGEIYFCSDYALECIRSMMKLHIPGALSHPALSLLREYDEKNESELFKTLYVYLENDCSRTKTAAQLNLHRNSLAYRINQITELTGICLESAHEREHLLFSFYL